jgi:NAD(P)-dependent dehydrogenase (short-subunit alcohol dehydrogenase family)
VHTALVTGAASGIGHALAVALLESGSTVVLADLDGPAAERAAEQLGPRASAAQLDVRDRDAVRELVQRVDRDAGGLDLLVNNAGTGVGGAFSTLNADHWRDLLEVNFYGVLHGIEAAYPLMRVRGAGQICSTSSLSGLLPAPTLAPYSTSKFAVVGLSLALRAEAATYGVRVSVLCPGFTETPLLDAELMADRSAEVRSVRPLIRAFRSPTGSPEVVARECLEGLRKDLAVIVTPRSSRLAWRAHRLAPRLVDRFATRAARQVLAEIPVHPPVRRS